ncbi:MAG: hypothetical protein ACI909_001660 [Planctomycetota bacterium]|jgi:hypothetical protein
MNKLELNISVSIFIIGAALFLLAPSGVFSSVNTDEIHMTALLIESIGVTTATVVFLREKMRA